MTRDPSVMEHALEHNVVGTVMNPVIVGNVMKNEVLLGEEAARYLLSSPSWGRLDDWVMFRNSDFPDAGILDNLVDSAIIDELSRKYHELVKGYEPNELDS